MGLVFLAAMRELPELVTTISAAMKNNAALVLNNMFGGITMQTAILALADGVVIHATLTSYPHNHAGAGGYAAHIGAEFSARHYISE